MIHLLASVALRARFDLQTQAMLFGAALGWVAWELSRVAQGSSFNLLMALVVVAAGSTSFVLYALHARGRRTEADRQAHAAAARNCLSLIGCGVALAIHGLQASLA